MLMPVDLVPPKIKDLVCQWHRDDLFDGGLRFALQGWYGLSRHGTYWQ